MEEKLLNYLIRYWKGFLYSIAIAFVIYLAASFADVLMHNTSDYQYAWWNAFVLGFRK